jgi:two-component system, chemotaxis family, protein-glutamate methylesterase/glutaminase
MKTQILIVDDSEVYRLFLRKILEAESDIEVVSVASNGRLALPRVNHYKPEVVVLDYEMPELDGLSAIPEIKRLSPHSRIIMFSAHTTRGAKLTLKALEAGADDFITKPAENLSGAVAETIRRKLVERIRAFSGAKVKTAEPVAAIKPRSPSARKKFSYCAIGISTGGPTALRRLFKLIPETIRGSIFVAQHMPPLFTAQLAESLDEESPLKIVEAVNGMKPEPASVYIAPGGRQMRLDASNGLKIVIEDGDPAELCKPSVNNLFHSLAAVAPEDTLAVIMTGMGEDGYLGMKRLASSGAYLMAQAEADCVIFGMPAKPIRDGIVHEIHTAEELAKKITEYLS